MELVLEQSEIAELLRIGLRERGVNLPLKCDFRIRRNGKKNTLRIVFVGEWDSTLTPNKD